MREVRSVGAIKVVLHCPCDVERALFANTPRSAKAAFAGLPAIACPVRLCCGAASKTLGNASLEDGDESMRLNKANFKKVSDAVAAPRKGPIPGLDCAWHGPVAVCPGPATHDIPQMNARWTAAFVGAALRHDVEAPRGAT